MKTKNKNELQLIVSIILLVCAYIFPIFVPNSEPFAIIVSVILTLGIILLISSVKSIAKYYIQR